MITVTESAREKLQDLLAETGNNYIRFGLQGGGCSGFSYFFSFEEKQEDDLIVETLSNGVLITDPISMTYLTGSEIDYKKDIMGETFVFNNPQVKNQCGCGNSVGF